MDCSTSFHSPVTSRCVRRPLTFCASSGNVCVCVLGVFFWRSMLASRFSGINNDNVSCLRCCSWRQRQRPFPIHTQFPALQPSQSYYLCIVACDLWICEIRLALHCTLALFFFPSPVRVQRACVCVCFASLSISNIARRRRPAPVCSLKQPLKRQGKQQEQPSLCVYKNGIPVRVAPHTTTRRSCLW